VRVTLKFKGLPYAELNAQQIAASEATLAESIASACGVDNHAVADLFGTFTSVTLAADGEVSALVKDIQGYTANELAARLYSPSFREELIKALTAIVGSDTQRLGELGIAAVFMKPEAFAPLVPTSTLTTTTLTTRTLTTTSTTVSSTATTTALVVVTTTATQQTTRSQHKDIRTTTEKSNTVMLAATSPWLFVLAVGFVVGRN